MRHICMFLLFAMLLFNISSSHPWYNRKMTQQLAVLQNACFKQYPVSKNVADKLDNRELVEDESFKNYTACVQQRSGFVNADGTYNRNAMIKAQSTLVGSHKYDKIIVDCTKNATLNDPVASTWTLFRCVQAEGTGEDFDNTIKFYCHV